MPPTKKARSHARRLRRSLTPPEVRLWARFQGAKPRIRRQHPIGHYIVDFYCAPARLVIEVEGMIHDRGDMPEQDDQRMAWLEDQGLTVIRVSATEVMADPDAVAESILRLCRDPSTAQLR